MVTFQALALCHSHSVPFHFIPFAFAFHHFVPFHSIREPLALGDSVWQRARARNVSFDSFNGGQFTLVINSVHKKSSWVVMGGTSGHLGSTWWAVRGFAPLVRGSQRGYSRLAPRSPRGSSANLLTSGAKPRTAHHVEPRCPEVPLITTFVSTFLISKTWWHLLIYFCCISM